MFALLIQFTVATNHVVYDLDFPAAIQIRTVLTNIARFAFHNKELKK